MRRIALTAVAVLTLALAPTAGAKEIAAAKVCGPDGCAAVKDEADRLALMTAGSPTEPPARAPFYRVSGEFAAEGHREIVSFDAIPGKAIRYDDGAWYAMTADQTALIDNLMGDAQAFPADGLMGAAEPPAPQPAPASDADSPLWPEGVIVAVIALLAAIGAVRLAARWRPASG
jgi:hypothetical protein